ncbi:MAG: extracellular solute-binding protein [Actinomycetota bacterium]|nr:extracellular solute-binding protein [Actinomycetota bacterium]
MRDRRWLVAALVFALIGAACQAGGEAPEGTQAPGTTAAPTETTAPPEAAEDTTPTTAVFGGEGEPVRVMASWGGDEAAGFFEVLEAFTAETNIPVQYEGQRELPTVLPTRVAGGNPPDVAMVPRPGIVGGFVADGVLVPLDDILGDALAENYSQAFIDLGTFDGQFYGLSAKANSKSTFWYKPPSFEEQGFEVPETWDETLTIVDGYVEAGETPLSIGGQDAWTLTDWFENLYIRVAGPEMYHQLFVTHEVAWTDPTVVEAMEHFQTIIAPTDEKLVGGAAGALSTGFIDAFDQMLAGDASMHYEGGFMGAFAEQNFPDLEAGTDYDWFEFPEINPEFGKPVVGGGDMAVLFNDNERAAELIRFLATPEAGEVWATAERGAVISPNQSVPLDVYGGGLRQKEAEVVLEAEIYVFDGSDLAPPEVGGDAMFSGLQGFIDNPDDIEGTLQFIEDVAAGAY